MIFFHFQKPAPPPSQLFTDISRSIASVSAAKKLYVTANLNQDGQTTQSDVWIQLPGQITAICKYPNTNKNRPTTWKMHLSHDGFLAVDPVRQWFLRRSTGSAKARKDLYNEFLSEIPPPAVIVSSPGQAVNLFTDILKGFPIWKRSTTSGRIVWEGSSKIASARLEFSPVSKRLLRFSETLPLKNGTSAQAEWKFVYHAWQSPPSIQAPAHFIPTGVISLAPPYPNYGSGQASELAKRSVDFYDTHHDLRILASPGANPVMIVATHGEMNVISDTKNWSYQNGQLTWNVKGGSNTTTKIPLGKLPEALAKNDLPNSRLIITLAGGHNFAIRTFLANYEGKVVGSIVLEGKKIDLVQLRGPAVQVLISVEEQTGFIREVESTTYDRTGSPLSKIDERFQLLGDK